MLGRKNLRRKLGFKEMKSLKLKRSAILDYDSILMDVAAGLESMDLIYCILSANQQILIEYPIAWILEGVASRRFAIERYPRLVA